MDAHTDGNDDQHQQVCDSWVIGKIAKDLGDLATGLGKIGRCFGHSESLFSLSAFISTFTAWLALSAFDDVFRFAGDIFLTLWWEVFFADFFVTREPPDFFFFVMRR